MLTKWFRVVSSSPKEKKTVAVEYQNIVCVCAYAVRFNITVKLGIG